MNTIWKYPLEINDLVSIAMPVGARILHVDCQQNQPMVWALVDPSAPKEVRKFRIVGTGHPFKAERLTHVATFQQPPYVWHVFE